MITKYLNQIKKQLPQEPRTFLFGKDPFDRLEGVYLFCKIYNILLNNLKLKVPKVYRYTITNMKQECVEDNGEESIGFFKWYALRKQCIHQNKASVELAQWFESRIIRRISKKLGAQLIRLSDYGFSRQDIIETVFLQGFNIISLPHNSEYWLFDHNNEVPIDLLKGDKVLIDGYRYLMDLKMAIIDKHDPLSIERGKKHLSCLCPDQLDFILIKLSSAQPDSIDQNHLIRQVVRKWDSFQNEKRNPSYYNIYDWYRASDKSNKLTENYLPVLERIKLGKESLELCFIKRANVNWYLVDLFKGVIKSSNQKKHKFHFALKKIGKARGKLLRGSNDILNRFVQNAMENLSSKDPNFLNKNCLQEMIWEKIDKLCGVLFKRVDTRDLKFARSMSKRYAIAWEIYGILKRYHDSTIEVLRLQSFIKTFPSLAKIVYPGFLSKYIISGVPLKKAIQYWSVFFRQEAQAIPDDYNEAKFRLMRAVLQTIGVPVIADQDNILSSLAITHFERPFKKQPRYKEAYIVWMLKQNNFNGHDFSSYYDFIEATEYVVNRYTTPGSLERRHDAWVMSGFEASVECKHPFPSPWLEPLLRHDDYSILHISNPAELKHIAIKLQNCVFTFAQRIVAGKVQIYALKKETQFVGTIEVMKTKEKAMIGQCAGYNNEELTKEQHQAISQWFSQTGEYTYFGPDDDIPF